MSSISSDFKNGNSLASSFTGIDLSYNMNTNNHEQDCSHFKVHDTRIR